MGKMRATTYVTLTPAERADVSREDSGRIAVWFHLLREGFTPSEANRLIELKIRREKESS